MRAPEVRALRLGLLASLIFMPAVAGAASTASTAPSTATTASYALSGPMQAGLSVTPSAPTAASTWSVWLDNDQYALVPARQERWYTQGMGLRRVSPWTNDRYGVVSVSHQMFTPASTRTPDPQPRDRPYAGALFMGLHLLRADTDSRTDWGAEIGLIGPSAGAEGLQRTVHRVLGQPLPLGWRYQLRDQPWVQVHAAHTWRLARAATGADLLLRVGAELGHPRNAIDAGVAARWGAVPEAVSWPGTATPLQHATRGWMVHGLLQMRAVASDALIDTSAQGSDSLVRRRIGVPQAGLGVSWALTPSLGVDASIQWRGREFEVAGGTALPALQRWGQLQLRGSFD